MLKSDKYIDLKNNIIQNKVCVFETDTVVGIGCTICSNQAINRIFDIKNRDRTKPLPWLISSKIMLKKYTKAFSETVDKHIKNYWPGNTTIVLEVKDDVDRNLTYKTNDGLYTVAFRIPDCPDLIKVIDDIGHPIACTSANITDEKPVSLLSKVNEQIINNVDFVYDKNLHASNIERPSKIISFVNGSEEILRN